MIIIKWTLIRMTILNNWILNYGIYDLKPVPCNFISCVFKRIHKNRVVFKTYRMKHWHLHIKYDIMREYINTAKLCKFVWNTFSADLKVQFETSLLRSFMTDSQSVLLSSLYRNSGPNYFVCGHVVSWLLWGIVCDYTVRVRNVCTIPADVPSPRKEITRMSGITALEASLSWRNKCRDVLSAGDMCVLEKNISFLR